MKLNPTQIFYYKLFEYNLIILWLPLFLLLIKVYLESPVIAAEPGWEFMLPDIKIKSIFQGFTLSLLGQELNGELALLFNSYFFSLFVNLISDDILFFFTLGIPIVISYVSIIKICQSLASKNINIFLVLLFYFYNPFFYSILKTMQFSWIFAYLSVPYVHHILYTKKNHKINFLHLLFLLTFFPFMENPPFAATYLMIFCCYILFFSFSRKYELTNLFFLLIGLMLFFIPIMIQLKLNLYNMEFSDANSNINTYKYLSNTCTLISIFTACDIYNQYANFRIYSISFEMIFVFILTTSVFLRKRFLMKFLIPLYIFSFIAVGSSFPLGELKSYFFENFAILHLFRNSIIKIGFVLPFYAAMLLCLILNRMQLFPKISVFFLILFILTFCARVITPHSSVVEGLLLILMIVDCCYRKWRIQVRSATRLSD